MLASTEYFQKYLIFRELADELNQDVISYVVKKQILMSPGIILYPLCYVESYIRAGSPANMLVIVEPYFWMDHMFGFVTRAKRMSLSRDISKKKYKKFKRAFYSWAMRSDVPRTHTAIRESKHYLRVFIAGLCDETVFKQRLYTLFPRWSGSLEYLMDVLDSYRLVCVNPRIIGRLQKAINYCRQV